MSGTMRTIPALTLAVLVVTVAAAAAADEVGALQVTCRPGHRVYLDGEFVGLTTVEQDGLHVKAIAPGRHEIRIEKLDLKPRTLTVTVRSGHAVEVRVPDLEPEAAGQPVPAPAAAPPATPSTTAAPAALAVGVAVAAAPVAAAAADSPAPAPSVALPPAPEPAAEAAATAPEPARVAESAAAALAAAAPAIAATPAAGGRPRAAAPGVGFVFRAAGTALASRERSVSVFRERGGPKVPVLAFVCTAPAGDCADERPASLAAGSYRFRVVCREAGAGRRDPDVFNQAVTVELEAVTGQVWEIAATYEASPPRCQAIARPLD
jgi:hypothetical protein